MSKSLDGDMTYRVLSFLAGRSDGMNSEMIAGEMHAKKSMVASAINHARRKGYVENRAPSVRGGRARTG